MNYGADINGPVFNGAEFNEPPEVWVLFLNPDTTPIPVYVSYSSTIPPSKLFPGAEYNFHRVSTEPVDVRFTTPPAIAYDGLGG